MSSKCHVIKKLPARKDTVRLLSFAHFDAMRPLLQRLFVLLSTWLALAGARVVSGRLTLSPQQPFQLIDYFTFDVRWRLPGTVAGLHAS